MAAQKTRFKIENGLLVVADAGVNTDINTPLNVLGNVNVNGNVMFISGNLTVAGNINYNNTSVIGNFVPSVDQSGLGNSVNRFDAFLYDVIVYNTLMPSPSGRAFGNTTARWAVFATAIDANSTLAATGNVQINSTAFVVDAGGKAGVNTGIGGLTNAFTVTGSALITGVGTITGNASVGGLLVGNASIFTNTATTTLNSQVTIDTYAKTGGQAGESTVFVKQTNSGDLHKIKLSFVQDGTANVTLSKYDEVYTVNLGTFNMAINGANVETYFTATLANNYTIKLIRTLII